MEQISDICTWSFSAKNLFNLKDAEQKKISPDYGILRNYLEVHYFELMRQFHASDFYTLDKTGMSSYDNFAEGLVDILEDSEGFRFTTDEATNEFISKVIKRASHRYTMANYREPLKFEIFEMQPPDWD